MARRRPPLFTSGRPPRPRVPWLPGVRSADRTVGTYWHQPGVELQALTPGQRSAINTAGTYWLPGQGAPGGQQTPGVPTGVIPRPPAGTYDPSLDAQLDAANRGFGDFQRDTELADTRAEQDYGFGKFDINRQAQRGGEDLANRFTDATADWMLQGKDLQRSSDRGMADILRDRMRGTEDYGTTRGRFGEDRDRALAVLDRNYRNLGSAQGQGIRAAGAAGGGASAQAAAKRAGNKAFERQPIDTAYGRQTADLDTNFARFGQDSAQAQTRFGEDVARTAQGINMSGQRTGRDIGIAGTRLGEDTTTALGRLGVGYERGVVDRTTGLTRARRENTAFGQDIGAARFYQARAGMGALPTYRPQKSGLAGVDPYSKLNRGRVPAWMRRRYR